VLSGEDQHGIARHDGFQLSASRCLAERSSEGRSTWSGASRHQRPAGDRRYSRAAISKGTQEPASELSRYRRPATAATSDAGWGSGNRIYLVQASLLSR
jgi:hypothetical protein